MSKLTETASRAKVERVARLLNPPRMSDMERSQLEGVFSDDPGIYTALRDLFYGFELDENQKEYVKALVPIKPILRKLFLPEVKKDIPFGQTYDLWQTQDLKSVNKDAFETLYDAKQIILQMLETSLERIDDPSKPGISLEMKKDLPFLLGRNGYIPFVDSQIRFLIQFVNQSKLSDAELRQIIQANSAK